MLKTGIYLQLAPVLFGRGVVEQAGEKAKGLGVCKAMLISDEGVRATGMVDRVEKILTEAGIGVTVWAKAETDCPDTTVREAAAIARAAGIDGVVGLGGGSVLDTAKAVAAVTVNGDGVLEEIPLYLTGQKQYAERPLTVVEIPTTAGTGSESTFVSVVTSSALDCKIGLPVLPDYGIVDPELTRTVPREITAFTGMDALAHAVEALTEAKATAHSDLLAFEAIRIIHEWLPRAVADGEDGEARDHMAYASNLAGIAFNESGTHIGHSAAHAIGHAFHIPHGICCSNMTPPVMRFTAKDYPEKIRRAGIIFGADIQSDEGEAVGREAAEAVRNFSAALGVKTFKELGLTEDALAVLKGGINADGLCHAYGGTVTEQDIEEMLRGAYADGR